MSEEFWTQQREIAIRFWLQRLEDLSRPILPPVAILRIADGRITFAIRPN